MSKAGQRAVRKLVRALEGATAELSTEALREARLALALGGQGLDPKAALAGLEPWLAAELGQRTNGAPEQAAGSPEKEVGRLQWMPWPGAQHGRRLPTYAEAEVEVSTREDLSGHGEMAELAGRGQVVEFAWHHDGDSDDIVAWRYVPGWWQRWDGAPAQPEGIAGKLVEVVLRDGRSPPPALAGALSWSCWGLPSDIMQWRLA